jgi:hypothetical protein
MSDATTKRFGAREHRYVSSYVSQLFQGPARPTISINPRDDVAGMTIHRCHGLLGLGRGPYDVDEVMLMAVRLRVPSQQWHPVRIFVPIPATDDQSVTHAC